MKVNAFRLVEHGASDVLAWQEIDLPEPTSCEVLVRHHAIGVNFIDIYHRQGLYPLALPSGLGLEAAGVVEAVGADVKQFKAGDRVTYCKAPLGAYSEAHIVPEDGLIALPDDIGFDMAAAMTLKGLTAAYLLHATTQIKPGMDILLHAAAGGVGLILSQWASALGARVIGTVGSQAKAELALANGCQDVILYQQEDVAARVAELTAGKGVEVVYDSVGQSTCESSLNSLARRGLFVSFGNASGPAPAIAPLTLFQKGSIYMTRPGLVDYTADRAEMLVLAEKLFAVVSSGEVKISTGQTYDIAEAAKAQNDLAERKTVGSSVLLVL